MYSPNTIPYLNQEVSCFSSKRISSKVLVCFKVFHAVSFSILTHFPDFLLTDLADLPGQQWPNRSPSQGWKTWRERCMEWHFHPHPFTKPRLICNGSWPAPPAKLAHRREGKLILLDTVAIISSNIRNMAETQCEKGVRRGHWLGVSF